MTINDLKQNYKDECHQIQNKLEELRIEKLKKNSSRIRDEIMFLNCKLLTLQNVLSDLEKVTQ
jgi:uncharacterized protein YbcI